MHTAATDTHTAHVADDAAAVAGIVAILTHSVLRASLWLVDSALVDATVWRVSSINVWHVHTQHTLTHSGTAEDTVVRWWRAHTARSGNEAGTPLWHGDSTTQDAYGGD